MITHVVMMKFKPEVTTVDIDRLEAMLGRLPERIDEIRGYTFGKDIVHSERSYDFALVSMFASLETLRRYRIHPDHQEVVKKLVEMCQDLVVVDYANSPFLR